MNSNSIQRSSPMFLGYCRRLYMRWRSVLPAGWIWLRSGLLPNNYLPRHSRMLGTSDTIGCWSRSDSFLVCSKSVGLGDHPLGGPSALRWLVSVILRVSLKEVCQFLVVVQSKHFHCSNLVVLSLYIDGDVGGSVVLSGKASSTVLMCREEMSPQKVF